MFLKAIVKVNERIYVVKRARALDLFFENNYN